MAGHLRSRPRSQRSPCSLCSSTTMIWLGRMTSLARPGLTWRTASTANTEPSAACRASMRCKFFLPWRHCWCWGCSPRTGKTSQGSGLTSQHGWFGESAHCLWGYLGWERQCWFGTQGRFFKSPELNCVVHSISWACWTEFPVGNDGRGRMINII